jgi:hypothetical protein
MSNTFGRLLTTAYMCQKQQTVWESVDDADVCRCLSRSGDEARLAALKENIQPVKEFVEIQVRVGAYRSRFR